MITYFKSFSDKLTEQTFINKFKDKKILVMGSGPSVGDTNWDKLDVDGIATCNNFYRNDKVRDCGKVIHVSFQYKDVNLADERLLEFFDNNKECTIAFDAYRLESPSGNEFYHNNNFKMFTERYKDRICGYDVIRVSNNHEGVAGRLGKFVVRWLPSDLYYLGIDGWSTTPKEDPTNAFMPFSGNHPSDNHYDYLDMVTAHTEFAMKMYEFSKDNNINLYNLGEGFEYNRSTEVSEKYFKLSDKIKNIIRK